MSGRRAGGWTRRVRHWGLPAVSVVAALWLVRGLWGPEPPGGLDTLAHLARTDFGLREVFARGHLDGWAPVPGVGAEIFLFYGPGLAMLVGALQVLSIGLLSTAGAFKVVLVASFAALPLSTVYLARGFGLTRRAAALAGVLALGVSSLYGPGIEGVFGLGLVPHQVAAPFTVFGLGAVVRLWLEPGRRRVLPVALSLTAAVLLHPISAFILAVMSAVVVALMEAERARRDRRAADLAGRPVPPPAATRQLVLPGMEEPSPRQAVRWGTAAGLAAAGLTAFWLVPFLAHQDLGGAASGWATPSFTFRLDEVLHGRVLFEPPVGWLVLGGMAAALLIRPGRRPMAMTLAPVAYLLVAHVVKDLYPYNGLAFQLPNRGLGYTGFLAVLPLAAAIDHAARRVRAPAWASAAVAAVASGATLAIAVWPMTDLVELTRGSQPRPMMVEAARQIRRLVPAHARFAVERQAFERDATGVESPPFWIALASGRYAVNAFAPETSTAPVPMYVGDSMTEGPTEEAADRLTRYGVTHVVSTTPAGAERFGSSPRFRREWGQDRMAIFAVLAAPDRPDAATQVGTDGPAQARLLRARPERLGVEVTAPAPVTATFAVAWSPKWAARLDGRDVEPGATDLGLLTLAVPAGTHTVDLAFERDVWDGLGAAVTAATLAAALVVAVRARRRLRPASVARTASDPARSGHEFGPATVEAAGPGPTT